MSQKKELNQEQLEKVSGGTITYYDSVSKVRWKYPEGSLVYSFNLGSGDWLVTYTFAKSKYTASGYKYYAMCRIEKNGESHEVPDGELYDNR